MRLKPKSLKPNTIKNKHNQSYKILRNIEFTFTLAYSVLIKIAYFKYYDVVTFQKLSVNIFIVKVNTSTTYK